MAKKPWEMIYGLHPVMEALEAGRAIDKILLRQGSRMDRFQQMRSLAQEKGIPIQFVPDVKLRKISGPGENHQGVIALLSAIAYQDLESILLKLQDAGKAALIVLLDGITDVRNFGAIARSAECMGANALVVGSQGAAAINATAIKVSAGALHHIPVCRQNHLVDALLLMQAYGIKSIACTEKARDSIYSLNLTDSVCLIMGSEEKGISNALIKRAEHMAQIPLSGQVSSLNVSVATGIALAEIARQRNP